MPIRKFAQFDGAFTEAYDIARRVEIVGKDRCRYRLDVFEDVGSEHRSFCVKCYVEKEVTLSEANGDAPAGATYTVWVEQELPWVDAPTADEALGSGMTFLAQRINEG